MVLQLMYLLRSTVSKLLLAFKQNFYNTQKPKVIFSPKYSTVAALIFNIEHLLICLIFICQTGKMTWRNLQWKFIKPRESDWLKAIT